MEPTNKEKAISPQAAVKHIYIMLSVPNVVWWRLKLCYVLCRGPTNRAERVAGGEVPHRVNQEAGGGRSGRPPPPVFTRTKEEGRRDGAPSRGPARS